MVWFAVRVRSCARFVVAVRSALGLALALFASGAARAQLNVEPQAFTPEMDSRRFFGDGDAALSKVDPRLLLPSKAGTIEFWAESAWTVSNDLEAEPLFCVMHLAGRRPAVPTAVADAASGAAGADKADGTFWPRYAIYLGPRRFALQTGDKLYLADMRPVTREALEGGRRVHFVVVFEADKVKVFADGVIFAQWAAALDPMKGPHPVTAGATVDHAPWDGVGWRLCVGGFPGGTCLVREIDVARRMRTAAEATDLAPRTFSFEGTLGGIRVWGAAIDESQITDKKQVLAQRGPAELRRSIAYTSEQQPAKAPRFSQLLLFSDFDDAEAQTVDRPQDLFFEPLSSNGLVTQYPFSGHWVNTSKKTNQPLIEPPPGLSDPYGNVDSYPLMSIFPTGDPDCWVVYQDAALAGLIVRNPAKHNRWEYTEDAEGKPNTGIVVTLDRERLRFDMTESGVAQNLFGGDRGQATKLVELERPMPDPWTGVFVDSTNGFYSAGLLRYAKTAYRAFDLSRMDFEAAFVDGGTGSTRMVFAPPNPLKQRFDADAGGQIVPYGFRYTAIERGSASYDSVLVHDSSQYAAVSATSVGSSSEWGVFDYNTSKSNSTKEFTHLEGDQTRRHSWLVSRAFTRDFNLTMDKSEIRLHEDFLREIHTLRDVCKHDRESLRAECASFVERWGTHYALSMTYGATMISERTVTEEERSKKEISGKTVEAEGKESTKARIPATMYTPEIDIYREGSEWKKGSDTSNTSGSGSGSNFSRSRTRYLPTGKELLVGEGGLRYEYPIPLFYDLRPLSHLLCPVYFSDPLVFHDVREELHRQIKLYLYRRSNKAPPLDDVGPPWLVTSNRARLSVRMEWFLPGIDYTQREVGGSYRYVPFQQNTGNYGIPEFTSKLFQVRDSSPFYDGVSGYCDGATFLSQRSRSEGDSLESRESLVVVEQLPPPVDSADRSANRNYENWSNLRMQLRWRVACTGGPHRVSLIQDGRVIRREEVPVGTYFVGETSVPLAELVQRPEPPAIAPEGDGPVELTAERFYVRRDLTTALDWPVGSKGEDARYDTKGTASICLVGTLTEFYDRMPRKRVSVDNLVRYRSFVRETSAASSASFKRPVAGRRIADPGIVDLSEASTEAEAAYARLAAEPVRPRCVVGDDGAVKITWVDAQLDTRPWSELRGVRWRYLVARRNEATRRTSVFPAEGTTFEDRPGGGRFTYTIGLPDGAQDPFGKTMFAFDAEVAGEPAPEDAQGLAGPGAGRRMQKAVHGFGGVEASLDAEGAVTLRWTQLPNVTTYRVMELRRALPRAQQGSSLVEAIDMDVEAGEVRLVPRFPLGIFRVCPIVDGAPADEIGSAKMVLDRQPGGR